MGQPHSANIATESTAPAGSGLPHHHSLPIEISSFIGRERELNDVHACLATTRLLTLTGAGGSGKTRLAISVATRISNESRGEVHWASLAPIESSTAVADALLLAVGGNVQSNRHPKEMLLTLMRDRHALLVLDNCEHVIDEIAQLVDELLRKCAGLQILATSREALGVSGETAWLVPPLTLPPANPPGAQLLAQAQESEAVRLFVARAAAVMPGFKLTASNAELVAHICRRLDGLPLALELAAARLRSLPLDVMATRLDDCFRLLITRTRTTAPRHQTLRAAIEWSYDLLSTREQQLLACLAIFAGSFELEAAETICATEDFPSTDVLDTLAALVEKSLVCLVESTTGARYRLLETVRQFAHEKLTPSEHLARMRQLHADYFVAVARDAAPLLVTAKRPGCVSRLTEDLDNLRAALAFTAEHDAAAYLRLVGAMMWFWYSLGLWMEGRKHAENALSKPEAQAPSDDRAAALFTLGAMAALQGEPNVGMQALTECVSLADRLNDRALGAYACNYIGLALGQAADPGCLEPTHRALQWAQGSGDLYAERLALLILGTYELRIGHLAQARSYVEQAVTAARQYDLPRELGIALNCLAETHIAGKSYDTATELLLETLAAFRRDPHYMFVARSLELLAGILCLHREWRIGVRLFAGAAAVRTSVGSIPYKGDAPWIDGHLQSAREQLDPQEFSQAWQVGSRLSLIEAIDDALGESKLLDLVSSAKVAAPHKTETIQLTVHVLGAFAATIGGQSIAGNLARQAKARELLLFLLVNPSGATREQIGLELWPDASEAQLRNNFHVTVHNLRKTLGAADRLVLVDNAYRLGSQVQVEFDLIAVEQSLVPLTRTRSNEPIDIAYWEAALKRDAQSLRVSELLPEWLQERCHNLRTLQVDALATLGARLLQERRFDDAVGHLERACQLDPTHETANRSLIQALGAANRTEDATRLYQRHVRALAEDLGVKPSIETRKLIEKIREPHRQ